MKNSFVAALFFMAATPALASPVHRMVTEVAVAHGVNPQLAHAIVQAESTYRCNARNGVHVGIMQVNPRTARGVGVHGSLTDCRTGLNAGMRYLAQALKAHGTGCAGISAYNTGIYGRGRCTSYGRKIMSKMSRIRVASN